MFIAISSGFSAAYLIHRAEITEKSAGEVVLGERKRRWEEIAKTLKEDEARIYRAVIELGGIIRQSELVERLVERTGLSEASVSRALDLLESRGLVERRRGMGNIVVLK